MAVCCGKAYILMMLEQMTHIQAACIPLFLDYKDVAAEAVSRDPNQ